jgi:hypothetical protein
MSGFVKTYVNVVCQREVQIVSIAVFFLGISLMNNIHEKHRFYSLLKFCLLLLSRIDLKQSNQQYKKSPVNLPISFDLFEALYNIEKSRMIYGIYNDLAELEYV